MRAEIPLDEPAAAGRADGRPLPARAALVLLTALALLGAWTVSRSPVTPVDPDLVRVIRFMAALKGGFALVALAACFWRLARPAGPWRTAVYVAGPPSMAAGALVLGALHSPAIAAGALHLGLLAVVAAALTDRDFLPDSLRRGRGRARAPIRSARGGMAGR
ncbi:hypothetical protein MKK69_18320 [Methylobacterium sp. J-026]|uniref:hypothetical protein n=1 Tax=Methylobacterium sp. J-026 TaxID=2836624 RepID=UPI001FBBD55F|nr:hypothetical protein [Methylobacterium sp. J-026]MCJ2135981.1 hypothetical protein [Methylobacterium sp. J-026]